MFSSIQIIGIKVIPGLLLIQGIIFLVIVWFLNKVLFKPTLQLLHEREERTEGFLDQADQIGNKGEKLLEEYGEKIRQAKKGALDLKRKHIEEGIEKKDEVLRETRQEVHFYIEEIRGSILKEVEATRKELYQQIELLGREIAEKVVGRSI